MVVTPDADLDMALRAILFGAVGTAGQRCTSLRRIIVHSSIKDQLLARVKAAYESLPIGNPLESGTLVLDPHKWFFQPYDPGVCHAERQECIAPVYHQSPHHRGRYRGNDQTPGGVTATMNVERNLWQHTAGPPLEAAALAGEVKADVVVIGGGYTGNSAALHLAQAGARVCLLEAETIGHGGSGRNVGLVNAGLWTPPDEVEATLGEVAGRKLNAALVAGPDLVFALIERHGIACEATRNGTLHCAHSKAGLADLRRRHAQQLARNAPVQLLDAEETARRTGTHCFLGALFDPRAGTIQPLAYARGLARAAIAAGAVLYEHSPVTGCRHDGAVWQVVTPQGSVTAKTLIQATNAYERRAGQAPIFTPFYAFSCATEPLNSNPGGAILPGGEGCWDTAQVMSWFRRDAAGRLIVGGVGNLDGWGGPIHHGWARRKLGELFPMAAKQAIDYAWCGRIAMTADHLPKIAQIGPNAVAIYGYSGRGIAPGTVFGKAAAQWMASGDPAAFPIAPGPVRHESYTTAKRSFYACGASLTHLVGARFARSGKQI